MFKKLFKRTVSVLIALAFAVCFLPACKPAEPGDEPGGGKTYRITFDVGFSGGKNPSPIDAAESEPIAPPADPEREGYKFGGWLLNSELYVFARMPNRNITLTAKWNRVFTITFDSDGGSAVAPLVAAEGEKIEPPVSPVKEEFKFNGWLLDGKFYYFTEMPSANIGLTAAWGTGTTITFDVNAPGVAAIYPITDLPGTLLTEPQTPVRAGYHFDGWYSGSGAAQKRFRFIVMPNDDLTLTAKWAEASKLPAVCVTLHEVDGTVLPLSHGSAQRPGGTVRTDRYTKATVSVAGSDLGTGAGGVEASPAQFKGRGHGSWLYGPGFENDANVPIKRPYNIRFDEKQTVLGMSKSRHWVLVSSHHNNTDRAMLIADVAFTAGREVFTNLEYTVRTKPVDLYINSQYRGVYILMEKWRAEKGRLDIESEHGDVDTGYLMKYTNASTHPDYARFTVPGLRKSPGGAAAKTFSLMSPDYDDIGVTPGVTRQGFNAQMDYIKAYMKDVADAMIALDYNKFAALADVPSFIDNIILQELYRNQDHGHGGCYIYKKPGGKLYAGSPWDFDKTCEGSGFGLINSTADSGATNPFITYLWAMQPIKDLVRARWRELSPKLKAFIPERYNSYINDTEYQAAFARNFARWPSHNSSAQTPAGWRTAAENNRRWVTDRITWLDGQWG